VLHHHERYDGAGYPSGLKGEDIPLEARIVCVADCFCAMTSDRPYKEGMSVEDACEELERCAGTQFDPRIVRLFVNEVRKSPPRSRDERPENPVFGDPEIQSHRHGAEPVLGYGTSEVTDNLTLLYSHRYFHEVAEAEAERAALQDVPFAVLMIRLEDLEDVNLSDGYAAGDEALRAVGRVVQAVGGRWGDATPSRYSGRRFTLLLPRASEQQAQAILAELTAEIEGQGRSIRTSVAIWEPGDSGGEVVGRARLGLELRPVGPA
jgi:diguanylate cyclase (GGDEF)-like protein